MYLVVVINWYSRHVLSYKLSRNIVGGFCRDALNSALRRFGESEYFNTDQGSQFTDKRFTGILEKARVTISMDGRGRVFDNIFVERLCRSVKYEDVYIMEYKNFYECDAGGKRIFQEI